MRFIFFSPVHFEDWDWRNSVERGIGGSETSHVEMAWRLARRGHEVISYAPIPPDCPGEWRGTFWKRYEEADFTQDGLWVIYRAPDVLDKFGPRRPDQPRWLMCQDTWYPSMTPERAAKLDRVLALCRDHVAHLQASAPYLADKLWLTSNGVKVDLVRELEARGDLPERNQLKLVYASSPDRGLVNLLDIFKRAKELLPGLELHVFYGMDNIEKLLAQGSGWAKSSFAGLKAKLNKLLQQPGVHWRGRVSQIELYREWLSAGIWCYPTDFTETSCQRAGSLVFTREGMKPIESVAVGDLVLTHLGRFRPVVSVSTRIYEGTLHRISRKKDCRPVEVTADHPLYVAAYHRRSDATGTRIYGTAGQPRLDWMLPGAIRPQLHRLVTPRMPFGMRATIRLSDYVPFTVEDGMISPNHRHRLWKPTRDEVALTEEFSYCLGVFAAEGTVSSSRGRRRPWYSSITTVHHAKERGIATRVAAFFGGRVRVQSPREIRTVSYSSVWANFLKATIGTGRAKRIPPFLWEAPEPVQRAFLQGILDGDGHRYARRNLDSYTSISPSLAYGVAQLLANIGIAASIQHSDARRAYTLTWAREERHHYARMHEAVWTSRVTRTDAQWYAGPVYALEVDEDRSYVTDRTIVHNCITSMEAQALGAIPITRPLWALTDNVRHGIWLDGTPTMDPLVRARYVGEIYRLATTPGLQERLREPMMAWARSYHNWERWVDQWECTLLGLPVVPAQFCFQHKHAQGRILNIGCASDPTGFMRRGAVNVDVAPTSPTGEPNAAHVLWDARAPFPALLGTFDTAILGDILEHMDGADRAAAIAAAAERLLPGGRLLITCPFDARPVAAQQAGATEAMTYAPGVHAYHEDVGLTSESLVAACHAAGLQVERTETLDYNFADGIGLIARKPVAAPTLVLHFPEIRDPADLAQQIAPMIRAELQRSKGSLP